MFAQAQLSSIGVPNEEGYRRELREFLFTAPGVSDCISGVVRALLLHRRLHASAGLLQRVCRAQTAVTWLPQVRARVTVRSRGFHSAHAAAQILFEETLYQDGSDGTPLVQVLQRQGIVPGARCRRLSQLCLASSPRMTRQPDAPRQASRWTRAWSTCRAPTGRAPLRCGAGGTVLERRAGRPPGFPIT